MIHAGSGAKSSCCGSLQDSLFFCTATLPYVLVSACWTCGGLNTRRLPPSQRNPAGPRIRREGARLPSDARVRTKTKGRGPPAACKVCNGMDASFFFAHLLVARAIGGFPLHPAEARTPERGRRRKAGPRPRNVPRAHPECTPPLPSRARSWRSGARSSSKRGARQRPSSGRGGARACCSRPDLRPPTPHMPSSDQRPVRRPSACAPHCAPQLAPHQGTTEAGAGPRRAPTRRGRASRLPSVRPRAAARPPVRPRAFALHTVCLTQRRWGRLTGEAVPSLSTR